MRPTSRASSGHAAPAITATPRGLAGSGGRLRLLDQALDRGRHLRAVARPVVDTVESDAQRLLGAGSHRVVEADALDEAAVAAQARIGNNDVEEGALLCAAACKPDHDHDVPLCRDTSREKPSIINLTVYTAAERVP